MTIHRQMGGRDTGWEAPEMVVRKHGSRCRSTSFSLATGARETHLFLEADVDGTFAEQLDRLVADYHRALDELGLPRYSAVFRRCLISDAANQLQAVMDSPLGRRVPRGEEAAVSVVEQPPLGAGKIALLAYHVSDGFPEDKTMLPMPGAGPQAQTLALRRESRTYLWSTQMTGTPSGQGQPCSEQQTIQVFDAYCTLLKKHDACLLDQAVRTWIFAHNVDCHYVGMVDARRELFLDKGLNPDTHYLVSTGIEGRSEDCNSLIMMDALAVGNLDPAQLVYVDCLDRLNRTDDYGVTFERSVRLEHGDRRHLYLAGTASIDAQGQVLHQGDIAGQTRRTLENIEALLTASDASMADVASMTVYLRDSADAAQVRTLLEQICPHTPYLMVRAPVCRPSWLIEIEALAITAHRNPRWPAF